MESLDQASFCVVYRGFDPMQAGMLARMLEAEGITCRHIGTHNPAFIGVGELACEQRLEVPEAELERARELLSAAEEEPEEFLKQESKA